MDYRGIFFETPLKLLFTSFFRRFGQSRFFFWPIPSTNRVLPTIPPKLRRTRPVVVFFYFPLFFPLYYVLGLLLAPLGFFTFPTFFTGSPFSGLGTRQSVFFFEYFPQTPSVSTADLCPITAPTFLVRRP